MCETANAAPDPRSIKERLYASAERIRGQAAKEQLYADAERIRDQAAKFAEANAQEAGRGGAVFGNAAGPSPIGALGYADDVHADRAKARRPRLRERVKAAYHNAERAADQTGRLGELEYLLGKHPDVARILELVEDTRV